MEPLTCESCGRGQVAFLDPVSHRLLCDACAGTGVVPRLGRLVTRRPWIAWVAAAAIMVGAWTALAFAILAVR